jgi:hypothetical protein
MTPVVCAGAHATKAASNMNLYITISLHEFAHHHLAIMLPHRRAGKLQKNRAYKRFWRSFVTLERLNPMTGIDAFNELRWITIDTLPGHYPI